MRACATVNLVALTGILCASLFSACTSSPPPVPPPASADARSPASGTAQTTAAPRGDLPAGPTDAGVSKPRSAPETPRDCRDLAAEITNEAPDKGVVMNNALTAADAGASDRLRPLIDLIKSKRDGFRCCFDLWAKTHAGESGSVTLHLALAPDGKLVSAEIKDAASTVRGPDLDSCMIELAQSLTYPRSPSGKTTELNYPFELKARR